MARRGRSASSCVSGRRGASLRLPQPSSAARGEWPRTGPRVRGRAATLFHCADPPTHGRGYCFFIQSSRLGAGNRSMRDNSGTAATRGRPLPAWRSRRRSLPARYPPRRGQARFELAEFVRGADEHRVDCADRPRISSGVSSCTSRWRTYTLTMSPVPITSSATSDSQKCWRRRRRWSRGHRRSRRRTSQRPTCRVIGIHPRRCRRARRRCRCGAQQPSGRPHVQHVAANTAAARSRHRTARRTGRAIWRRAPAGVSARNAAREQCLQPAARSTEPRHAAARSVSTMATDAASSTATLAYTTGAPSR